MKYLRVLTNDEIFMVFVVDRTLGLLGFSISTGFSTYDV